MRTNDRTTPRREFIGQLATAAAVLAGTGCAAPAVATQGTIAPAPASPVTPPIPTEFDDTWTSRLTGKHRAVFDSPDISGGLALHQAALWMRGYQQMYKAPDADTQAVIVLRHAAVPMTFGDAIWERYALGRMLKLKDPTTGQPAKRNPFLHVERDDPHALVGGSSTLEALHSKGATIIGCNLAAMGFASRLARATKQDAGAVQREVRANLVPGAILLPSGIFAVHRAQEAGCTYIRSA